MSLTIRILETAAEMAAVEALQRVVWPGSETDVVPAHLLITFAHNGGLVIGAFDEDQMIGFVFGFPGMLTTPEGPRLKHCSHQLGVHPAYRDRGVGYTLKRAQWQLVRNQGVDLITWTYDPLQSRNANLNITKLGSVCRTYKREVYGRMRDGLNVGIPSDRFQVELWVNSPRVNKRLARQPRRKLDLAHFFQAGAEVCNPTSLHKDGFPVPPDLQPPFPWSRQEDDLPLLILLEIPADFQTLKAQDLDLALAWRLHTRLLFEDLFAHGYLVTDFVFLPGRQARSYYVLSHGESTLGV